MTRMDILEAAALIFRQKGFHAASMQEIADAVNLRKASLYHHVPSKQQILLQLLDMAMDILIDNLQEIARGDGSPEERLRQAIQRYLEILTAEQDLAAVLLLEYRSLEADLKERHQPRRDQFERLWRDLIMEGVALGTFACPSPSMAAKTLLGTMNWTISWYRAAGPMNGAEIGDHYALLFLNGLLVRN